MRVFQILPFAAQKRKTNVCFFWEKLLYYVQTGRKVITMKPLSAKRQQILQFIETYTAENGYPPSVREISQAVNLRSPSTVHSHLNILRDSGYLDKSDRRTRALTLRDRPQYSHVPLLGRVTAGMPILAQQEVQGYVPYPGQSSEGLFALRVCGDSMIGAGILDGDSAIVRNQPTAEHGQIVVALLGDEATVKRRWRQNGKTRLMPENPAYAPIDGASCAICGIVIALYRPSV